MPTVTLPSALTSSGTRTPAQAAAYKELQDLARRHRQNGKDIKQHHLESRAVDAAIALEIRNSPVSVKRIVDRLRHTFGMLNEPEKAAVKRVIEDLDYTSGKTGKIHGPFVKVDSAYNVINQIKLRYGKDTEDIVAYIAEVESSQRLDSEIQDATIEDAAQGGIEGLERLIFVGRKLSQEQLESALRRACEVGKQGEELVDRHFAQQLERGRIESYQWVSKDNPVSPFDFVLIIAGERRKIEVKATEYDFKQPLHISLNELRCMRHSKEPYHLYRLYNLNKNRASFRIARNVAKFAERVLCALSGLYRSASPSTAFR